MRVSYEETTPVTTLDQGRESAYEPERIFGGWIPARVDVRRGCQKGATPEISGVGPF
ncbi:hypothetical protein OIE75_16090 [Streptomyces sp. NBC_01723]|uniref:hypothetical protein n=1 Tax=Streptomyces sp. NBC_01723 TaxID=2975921 RepID=UPI002E3752FD|nr:hypothetical protein [Streptomyces sp. NBC_01723]